MTRLRASGLGLLAALLLGAGSPAAASVTRAIKLDNFGYRATDSKIAIFTSDPGPTVQVRTAGGATVFTVPANGGSITSRGFDAASGDQVWWVDFSAFTTLGSYHLHSPSLAAESHTFAIDPAVYNEAVRAALKTFYYQRCNTPKAAAHAGSWADGAICHSADATTGPAAGHVDRGIKDLRGGWHDAGDYNKYVWSATGTAVLFLLKAYEDNPGLFRDGDQNVPESGNGLPDILDEVKWELDWLLRMQLANGSVLSQTHVPTFLADSPPSVDANLRYYQDPNLESGAIFAGSCAVGARVFLAAGQASYAATLRNAALSTWSWLLTQGNSPHKAWAAAEIFRMDPTISSAGNFVAGFHPASWSGVFLNVVAFDTQAALAYVQTPGASATVVSNMRASIGNQVNYIFGSDDAYRNGMPDWSYYWGSNAIRAGYGVFLMTAARLGLTGSHTAARCREHALELLHFFHGQNTANMVYLTNMAGLGGEHSSWQMYHAWFGLSDNVLSRAQYIGKPAAVPEPHYPYYAGTDNHGVNDNKISALGPAPGFVVGGPNASYGGDATPPLGAVYPNRFYRDWNDQTIWTARTWEITENSIGYQGPYVALGAYFMEPSAPVATLSVDDVSVAEGDTGSTNVTFTVTLTPASAQPLSIGRTAARGLTISDAAVRERVAPERTAATFTVTLSPPGTASVDWATADGTAIAGRDYTAASGSLSFTASQSTLSVTVAVHPDAALEGMETFVVNLSRARGAVIAHGTGTARVLDPARTPVPRP